MDVHNEWFATFARRWPGATRGSSRVVRFTMTRRKSVHGPTKSFASSTTDGSAEPASSSRRARSTLTLEPDYPLTEWLDSVMGSVYHEEFHRPTPTCAGWEQRARSIAGSVPL